MAAFGSLTVPARPLLVGPAALGLLPAGLGLAGLLGLLDLLTLGY